MVWFLAFVGIAAAMQLKTTISPSLDPFQLTTGTSTLTTKYPFYHTSDELLSEVKILEKTCVGATVIVRHAHDHNTTIDTVFIKKPGTKPVNKVFGLFGEHSRELISPESGLALVKMLCGQLPSAGSVGPADVLADSEFFLILNGNPSSRRKVEDGQYCLRVNENGVDLNRNWAARWQEADSFSSPDTNPGSAPFSEAETRIFRNLLAQYKPTTFLTIHSGTYGMYMPWAYDTEHMGTRNQKAMLQILEDVDRRHCECPFGSAGKEVGYSCPGTCLDYAYDTEGTPFAFAFEIYTAAEYKQELRDRWNDKVSSGGHSLIQSGEHLAHPHFHDLFQQHKSDFVHLAERPAANRSALARLIPGVAPTQFHVETHVTHSTSEFECFHLFNPGSEATFNETIINWASAYLEVASLVSEKLRHNNGQFLSKSRRQ